MSRSALIDERFFLLQKLPSIWRAIMDNDPNDGYDLKWKDHVQEIFGEVQKLRARDYFSDIIVHCGGRNFRAHKVILAASSTFFERVLTGIPKDRSQVLVMSETKPDLLELLLNFIYDGETFVPSDLLDKFMETAETLGIRGLRKHESEDSSKNSRETRKRPASRLLEPEEPSRDTDDVRRVDPPPSSTKRPRPRESQPKSSLPASVVIESGGDKAGPSGAARASASGLQIRPAPKKVVTPNRFYLEYDSDVLNIVIAGGRWPFGSVTIRAVTCSTSRPPRADER